MIRRWHVLSQSMALLTGVVLAWGVLGAEAQAKDCKKGKKPCGDKCIPAKKVCKEDAAPAAAAPAPAAGPACKKGKKPCGDACIPVKKVCKEDPSTVTVAGEKKGQSASEAEVSAALQSQAGQAMLQLARALQKSGELDVDDKQRAAFKQGLRGMKAAPPVCGISHVQLVRDCDQVLKSNVTLPCYLAVDEMAEVCKALSHPMPQFK